MSLFSTGGMLTGKEIEYRIKKGHINIFPYDPKCINPNSYNLKLHPQLLIYARNAERANVIPKKTFTVNHCQTQTNTKPKYECYEDKDKFPITGNESGNICITNTYSNNIKASTYISIDDKINDNYNEIKNIPIVQSNYLQPLDMHNKNETIEFEIPEEGYILQPGVLYIGRTVERTMTDRFIPMINGRSSGGRLGISIHICAGFGDIGFDGTWTLEITVVEPVRIYPYEEIAQICFFTSAGKKAKLYRGRYYNQEEATASRFYQPKKEY